jgi:hypothetical protein
MARDHTAQTSCTWMAAVAAQQLDQVVGGDEREPIAFVDRTLKPGGCRGEPPGRESFARVSCTEPRRRSTARRRERAEADAPGFPAVACAPHASGVSRRSPLVARSAGSTTAPPRPHGSGPRLGRTPAPRPSTDLRASAAGGPPRRPRDARSAASRTWRGHSLGPLRARVHKAGLLRPHRAAVRPPRRFPCQGGLGRFCQPYSD